MKALAKITFMRAGTSAVRMHALTFSAGIVLRAMLVQLEKSVGQSVPSMGTDWNMTVILHWRLSHFYVRQPQISPFIGKTKFPVSFGSP